MLVDHHSASYDPGRERAWHLSVWMAPDLNAWCVHDRDTGTVVALHADKGERLPAEDALPKRPASVSFTALPEISTLVPESALTPGSEVQHLKMVHGTLPTGLLRDEPIGVLGARCVYLHDEQAEHRLLTRFPHARPLPLQAILVQGALARSGKEALVWMHRSAQRLDLAIAQDKRLLLSNTFHAVGAEDLLYYALFALEQCGLAPQNTLLLGSGTHLAATEEALLARYFPRLTPMPAPDDGPIAGLRIAAPHRWAALLEQFACAS